MTLPLLWVVITGAPLGHTVDWKLDQRMITHPWVLKAYGMVPEGKPVAVEAGGYEVAEWSGQLFLDGSPIGHGRLVAAVEDSAGVAVIASDAVYIFDVKCQLYEKLGSESLPPLPIVGGTRVKGLPMLKTESGWYRFDVDWLDYEKVTNTDIQYAKPEVVTDQSQLNRLQAAWSGGGLPLSRILLDLHAGRFLGPLAPYFYDLVALSTTILCVSGLVLYFRRPRRERRV